MQPVLLLASKKCSQCLTTRNRIVTGERAAELVRACREEHAHFHCHKGSQVDRNVHCRGVHDIMGGDMAYHFANANDIPVLEIDPDGNIEEQVRAGSK